MAEFVEYPKWLHRTGRPDVLASNADEEAVQIAAWDAEIAEIKEPSRNALVDRQPRVVAPEPSTVATPKPAELPGAQAAVTIPDDWRDLPYMPKEKGGANLRSLASKVSSEPVLGKEAAIAAIEAELTKRA